MDLCGPLTTSESCVRLVEEKLAKSFDAGIRRICLVMPPDMSAKDFDVDKAKRRYRNYPAYGLGLLAQNQEMFS